MISDFGCARLSTHCRIWLKYLPAAMKLGQGNIFTSVCQEFCPQGGLPQCMLGYPPNQAHTPPQSRPHRPGTPPGADPPPRADTPHPWEHTPPQSRHTLPGSRLQHTVNERPVHILLECILVCVYFLNKTIPSQIANNNS